MLKRTVFLADKNPEGADINGNEQVLPLKRAYEANGHLGEDKEQNVSFKKLKDVVNDCQASN